MNPRVLLALFVLAVSTLGTLVLVATREDAPPVETNGKRFAGAVLPTGLQAPDLGLTDQDGERVRMAELRGDPVVVTFLYSNCRDSCPLQAQQVKGALDDLGRDVPAIAISVDPENDTEQSARAFLSKQRMTGRMRFVLGTRKQLQRVWRGYAIQPQLDDLDHTSRIVLLDGEGVQRVGYSLTQVTPEGLAHDLRLLESGI